MAVFEGRTLIGEKPRSVPSRLRAALAESVKISSNSVSKFVEFFSTVHINMIGGITYTHHQTLQKQSEDVNADHRIFDNQQPS